MISIPKYKKTTFLSSYNRYAIGLFGAVSENKNKISDNFFAKKILQCKKVLAKPISQNTAKKCMQFLCVCVGAVSHYIEKTQNYTTTTTTTVFNKYIYNVFMQFTSILHILQYIYVVYFHTSRFTSKGTKLHKFYNILVVCFHSTKRGFLL